jgi:hypothetical protein
LGKLTNVDGGCVCMQAYVRGSRDNIGACVVDLRQHELPSAR